MAFFTGANIDPGANVLYDPMAARRAQQDYQRNNLLMQGEQQRQGGNEMDQIGRAAAGVLTLPPEQQEAGYNAAVQRLQSYGYAKNAPAFPGADKLRGFVNQTLPVETQYQLGLISSPGLDAALKAANAPLPGASPAAGGAAATSGGASLGRAESGGNPAAVNAGGYSGTYQMGKARMADLGYYQPAPDEDMKSPDWPGKVSVPGFAVSNQADYLKNPAAQNAVFNQHMANIDQAIGATPGADKMDPNGLRAVAHLGGVTGMQKFVATGGLYDPADANGTKLSDYYQRFAGQGAQQGGGVAARTPGAVDVAGPGAGPGAPAGQPVGPQAGGGGQAAPAAAPPVATGTASAQYQNAAELMRRANAVEMAAPADPRAKLMAQSLRQQAQLLMQTDSVAPGPGGVQIHTLTGKADDAAKPLSHFVQDPNTGTWYDTTATTKPEIPRPPSLFGTPGGDVIQGAYGGRPASVVYTTSPERLAEQEAAKSQGSAAGAIAGKSVKEIGDLGRDSTKAIENINYGVAQLDRAQKGGINTGYFAPALAKAASVLKAAGLPTQIAGVDPSAIGDIQTARKTLAVVSGAILQQILGRESPITDAKIEAFIHAQPDITNDPDAVRKILGWAQSQFVYDRNMATAAMHAAAPTGMLPMNFSPQYVEKFGFGPIYDPLTNEMKQPDGQGQQQAAPAASSAPSRPVIRYDHAGKRISE
jgi:hypothetical protein